MLRSEKENHTLCSWIEKSIFQFHSKSHTHIEYKFQWIWRAHGDFNTHIVITDACHHNTIFRYTLFVFALRIHSIFTWLCVYLALCLFFRHFDRCCFECYFLFLKFFLVLFSLVFLVAFFYYACMYEDRFRLNQQIEWFWWVQVGWQISDK